MHSSKHRVMLIVKEDLQNIAGGMGNHVLNLCNELCEYVDVTVVSLDTKTFDGSFWLVSKNGFERVGLDDWKSQDGRYRVLKVFNTNDFNDFGIKSIDHTKDRMTENIFQENILRFLGGESFDLIHLHDSTLFQVAKVVNGLFNVPIVTTIHLSFYMGCDKTQMLKSNIGRYCWQVEGSCYSRSDKLIAVSQYYAEQIERFFLRRPEHVIYNGIHCDKFLKAEPLKNLFPRKKTVGFVGRCVESKGIDTVIHCIKNLPDHHFLVFSSFDMSKGYISRLSGELLEMEAHYSNFTWYNYFPFDGVCPKHGFSKIQALKGCDVIIMPSLHEPFGIAGVEAQLIGRPFIVSETGGLAEICLKDGVTFVDPEDPDAWVEAIRNVKYDQSKIDICVENATSEKFSWPSIAKETYQVYMETLDESRKHSAECGANASDANAYAAV